MYISILKYLQYVLNDGTWREIISCKYNHAFTRILYFAHRIKYYCAIVKVEEVPKQNYFDKN